jgi:hypothetical protein
MGGVKIGLNNGGISMAKQMKGRRRRKRRRRRRTRK